MLLAKRIRSSEADRKSFSMSHPKNHYFCGLDEGGGSLARFEVHFTCRSRCDNRSDLLFTDRNYHLGHKAADLHALNSPDQLVSAAQAAHHQCALRGSLCSRAKQQAVVFALRNAVMPPGGANAANLLPVNPLLNRRLADLNLHRRVAWFEQFLGLGGLQLAIFWHLEPNRTVAKRRGSNNPGQKGKIRSQSGPPQCSA